MFQCLLPSNMLVYKFNSANNTLIFYTRVIKLQQV